MAMEGSEKWGAVFDWDGVIVDSSRLHEEAWEALAAEERRPLPPGFFLRSFGMKNEQVIEQLLGWTADPKELERLSLRKEELFRALVRERGARLLPGARRLLEALAAAGIPRAVGSSTPRKNIEAVLAQTGLAGLFDATVCGDEVRRGKPAPDIFLEAARRLGLPPTRCVVIEDAHVGIEAARTAGMPVLAVATTHPAEKLKDADLTARSLREVGVDALRALALAS